MRTTRMLVAALAALTLGCGTSRERQIERRQECDWRCYDMADDAGRRRDPITEHVLEHCLRECCQADRYPELCE